MYIKHDSPGDTAMRWNGTFCYYKERAKDSVVYIDAIDSVTENSITMAAQRKTKDGWEPIRFENEPLENFLLDVPTSGYINYRSKAYFVTKMARTRMYSLGAVSRRYRLEVPNPTAYAILGKSTRADFAEVYHFIANDPHYSSVRSAVSQILSKKSLSRALSKHIALGISLESAGINVYRNNRTIAVYDVDKDVVLLKYPHIYFREELEELGFNIEMVEKYAA